MKEAKFPQCNQWSECEVIAKNIRFFKKIEELKSEKKMKEAKCKECGDKLKEELDSIRTSAGELEDLLYKRLTELRDEVRDLKAENKTLKTKHDLLERRLEWFALVKNSSEQMKMEERV